MSESTRLSLAQGFGEEERGRGEGDVTTVFLCRLGLDPIQR